jgi:predicted dehydrogenase
VGTGWWADLEHLPGLRSRSDVELVALCGRNPDRLATLADRHRVPLRFTDWREMLAQARLDVVTIVTPNVLHHPIARGALEAGAHVICEKPLAMDATQARELADLAEARGRETLTFFTHRALAAATHAKALVGSDPLQGFLGRPLHLSATYFSASHLQNGKPASWRMRRAESGTGVLGDIGSHLVDMVRWWLGDLTAVSAQWLHVTRERPGGAVDADEACFFLARSACGAQAVFQASKLVAGRGNYQRIELFGERASLVYEAEPGIDVGWSGRLFAGSPGRTGLEPVQLPPELLAGLDAPDPEGRMAVYRRLTDPFFAKISGEDRGERSGEQRPEDLRPGSSRWPTFRDGAAVQAVLDAVAASAESGAWTDVR